MAATKKLIKKETRKKIYEKLSVALAEYKDKLNDKEFDKKLKKASKLFAVDVVKARKNDRKASSAKELKIKK